MAKALVTWFSLSGNTQKRGEEMVQSLQAEGLSRVIPAVTITVRRP